MKKSIQEIIKTLSDTVQQEGGSLERIKALVWSDFTEHCTEGNPIGFSAYGVEDSSREVTYAISILYFDPFFYLLAQTPEKMQLRQ